LKEIVKEIVKEKVFALSTASGCLTNLMETTSLRNSLLPDFFEKCEKAEDADIVIVNTCGYNNQAEDSSVKTIQDLQTRFPNKRIVVSGCLPRINKKRLEQTLHESTVRSTISRTVSSRMIVSTGELEKLNSLFDKPLLNTQTLYKEASGLDQVDLDTRLPSNRTAEKLAPWISRLHQKIGRPNLLLVNILESMVFDQKTFAISVSRGCLGKCTYCAIKKAKGKLVSRHLPEIVTHIRLALEQGMTRIHLLADDVGCWGQDQGLTSAHLLSAIFSLPFDFKLIINYFDPTWLVRLDVDLRGSLSDPRLVSLNVPLQSGNNVLLKAMDRDYAVEDALRCLQEIKLRNPSLALKTHLMVGYPGETHSQFLDSLKVLKFFDLAFPNKYGPRPGTPAEKLTQLSEGVKTYRFLILQMRVHLLHLVVIFRSLFLGQIRGRKGPRNQRRVATKDQAKMDHLFLRGP
jgi:tRNA A37 methylthiotransferase MiaB